jgi:hypothetical protein
MPLLNNIVASIKMGWANLNNEDNLTMLTFLSTCYIFLIYANYSIISDSIYSGQIQLFGIISVEATTIFILFLAISSCISIFAGAYFSKKYSPRLQIVSVITGLLFAFSLYLPIQGEFWIFVYSIIAGIVATIGISNVVTAFISKTNFSNRGSTSGILTLLVYLVLFVFVILVGQLRELAIVLIILKIFSLFPSLRIKEFTFDTEVKDYIKTNDRIKLSFLLVWVIFNISNIAASAYLQNYIMDENVGQMLSFGSTILGLITIFVGGILMDIYGRKRLIMFSFAYLGANYALISFSGGILYWFTVLDGIAWGILTVMFLLVLWGDICKPSNRSFWVAISLSVVIITYPADMIASYLINQYGTISNINNIFPITSFFLFIAVVIILYLPETLPEKIIQKKELDDYIHMAKKVKEKYKNGKKS